MFIQTEGDPDPHVLRFLPDRPVASQGREEFSDPAAAAASPLARRLFAIDGVNGVTLDGEAVIVRRRADVAWFVLKPPIFGAIMDHFAGAGDDAGLTRDIEALLHRRIRPALQQDGSDIVLRGVVAGTAQLELVGADFGMPVFAVRLRIENTLRRYLPAIRGVDFVSTPLALSVPAAGAGTGSAEGLAVRGVLDEQINPSVAAHGGHVSLVGVADGAAFIRLEGGCQGCGMSDITLRHGVEAAILAAVPGIERVIDVTDHESGTDPYFTGGHG